MTVTIDLRADPERPLDDVVEHIRAGGLVAYPTETVYGIGGAATEQGVAALRAAKGREADKPVLVLVASAEEVDDLAWTEEARTLVTIFWPGSVTLVLRDPGLRFPAGVRSPGGTVGVRVTPHPIAHRLVIGLDAPLTSTSLNVPGSEPARSADEAREALDALGADGVWLLDGGTLPLSRPSTVVDCTSERPRVLRAGAVPAERLRCALPEIHG